MKNIKFYILTGFAALALTSCNDFLTTVPKDAMSPSSTWKTQDDVSKFLTGCYDGWEDGGALLYWDCGSDFGYNNFPWEGFRNIGNGSFSPSDPGWSFYSFTLIRRVNTLLVKTLRKLHLAQMQPRRTSLPRLASSVPIATS